MTRNILLVKLSSMGDVVHSFPALSEAASHGHRFDWVVEEAFTDLAAAHPAVDRVIPFCLRRWRKQPASGMPELLSFVRELRAAGYEQVLDAQGLVKSAFITRASGAPCRMGLDRNSAREGVASLFYTRAASVSWELHAIDRLRCLFARSLDYEIDLQVPVTVSVDTPVGGDLSGGRRSEPAATVLVHGTTWPSKEYPEVVWLDLIERLTAAGHLLQIVSGSASEHARALRFAGSNPKVRAVEPGSLMAAFERIRTARLVIGVDSGLTHLAAVLGRPVIGLYGATSEVRTGARGPLAANLASGFSCAPCLRRECTYAGPEQQVSGNSIAPACYAELTPERIMTAASALLRRTAG